MRFQTLLRTETDGISISTNSSMLLRAFWEMIRKLIEQQAEEPDIADIFTEISRGADKGLWFVEAYVQIDN
jgi:starvation-inducible DNA-binding protein